MASFADLGVEFPLFHGPIEDSHWVSASVCVLCGETVGGFELGIGDDIIVSCSSCRGETAVPATGETQACLHCSNPMVVTNVSAGDRACWKCLRAGRWAVTTDTEAGMVRWMDAARGRTHGVHLHSEATQEGDVLVAGFPTSLPNDDGWREVIVPTESLMELTRTPNYITWQGEQWLFHCCQPMRYLGRWGRDEFQRRAPIPDRDGREYALLTAGVEADVYDEHLPDDPSESWSAMAYMFECTICRAHRGHWDMD